MSLVNRASNFIADTRKSMPLSTRYLVDKPSVERIAKKKGFKTYSIAPMTLAMGASVATSGSGVFWDAFMEYIFPWMLDIAKVFCAIKVAQAFYQERRGGRDEGTGFGALVTYGKWYLVFWLIPWGVELIDEIGATMLNDLRSNKGG